jgi:4-amino-4-deoxy-L-arabinose transferase-like glycosyltransferase
MSQRISRYLPALVWAVVIFCSFYNLSYCPTVWWDEAIFSETAANLTRQGRYAFTIQSPDNLNDFDYRISAGPVIIMPVALAYRLFGVNLWSGRLVAGAFLLLTFVLLYLSARLLLPRGPALLAVLLGLVSTDILYWGRSVLGDVPALACFLGGVFFLTKGLQEEHYSFYAAAGCCLGLAVGAKEFYGFTLFPALASLIWEYRRRRPVLMKTCGLFLLGAALPLTAYLAFKASILGGLQPALYHFYFQKKLLCHEFFTPFTIGRLYPESAAFLLTHPLFISGLLGLWLYQRRYGWSLPWLYWLINLLLWSLFYILAVYWHRFALPALLLASPWAGFLLVTISNALWHAAALSRHPTWARIGGILIIIAIIFPLCGVYFLQPIITRTSDSPFKLVDYLRQYVPNQFLIETPEYELPFLDAEHRYHLMPEFYFVESTKDKIVLANPCQQPYDFARIKADLLILGSFGKSVFKQNYPLNRVQQFYRKIATIDYYDIYLRRDRALGNQAKALTKPRLCFPHSRAQ